MDLTIKQPVNGPLQEAIIFKNEPHVRWMVRGDNKLPSSLFA